MRAAYVHEATVRLEPGDDARALGGAVTVALCGHWEHPPPCPLAPHHTSVEPDGELQRLRVLFVCEADDEQEVRRRIDTALAHGSLNLPDHHARWHLLDSAPELPTSAETAHAARLSTG